MNSIYCKDFQAWLVSSMVFEPNDISCPYEEGVEVKVTGSIYYRCDRVSSVYLAR